MNSHTNLTEINQALDLLWRNEIPPEKVSMGLGFYGRSFTLQNASCAHEGCIWTAGADAGPCTGNVGILSFAEIEQVIQNDNATITYNQPAAIEEVVWHGNQWVSFDDARSFAQKYHYANSLCLGGLLVWAASLDDRNGTAQKELCESLGCTVRVPTNVDPLKACGSSSNCTYWHTVIPGDTCYGIYTAAGISFTQLRLLNPELHSNCDNLLLGYQYCVGGAPTGNNTATCTTTSSLASMTLPTSSIVGFFNFSSLVSSTMSPALESSTSLTSPVSVMPSGGIPSSIGSSCYWTTSVVALHTEL